MADPKGAGGTWREYILWPWEDACPTRSPLSPRHVAPIGTDVSEEFCDAKNHSVWIIPVDVVRVYVIVKRKPYVADFGGAEGSRAPSDRVGSWVVLQSRDPLLFGQRYGKKGIWLQRWHFEEAHSFHAEIWGSEHKPADLDKVCVVLDHCDQIVVDSHEPRNFAPLCYLPEK